MDDVYVWHMSEHTQPVSLQVGEVFAVYVGLRLSFGHNSGVAGAASQDGR
jgi:hypothetical protein